LCSFWRTKISYFGGKEENKEVSKSSEVLSGLPMCYGLIGKL
jgi:hypothetical protein